MLISNGNYFASPLESPRSPPGCGWRSCARRGGCARTRSRPRARASLSPTLTAALATVENHGPLTPSELAERERVRRPTATRIVARLVELGLVTRTPDPADGRGFLVAPTAEGRRC